MFLLDTNVLSDMMSARPSAVVATWLLNQPSEVLFTAALCQAEILAGIAVLPEGRRRSALEAAAYDIFAEDFEGRILPFDVEAAGAYAELFAVQRKSGLPTATIDLMVAAIARVKGANIVTRNVSDFAGCGVGVINPWGSD